MKKIKYIVFASLLGVVSCKKTDLELFPYNQIETSQAFNTETDVTLAINGMYAGLRTSGSYFVNGTWNIIADVLADNLISNRTGPGRGTLLTYSEWRYTGESTYGLFSGGYSIVRRANAILENIDKFPDGAFKNNAKGEALALRAMVYFDMSRVYSKTYLNASDADSTMPYVISTDPTIMPAKESVKDFYGKVIADLESAKTLIGSTNGIYRLNKVAVSGLLSRVYLYKGDWTATIQAATDALGTTPNVTSRADFPKIWIDADPDVTKVPSLGVLFKVRNTKLDNVNSQGVNYYQTVGGERKSEYVVEYNFKQLFTANDIRTSTYIATSNFNGQSYNNVIKYNGRTNGDPAGVVDGKVLRTAEVLLNRAEAYYRANNEAAAIADLVLLKSNRYSSYDPTADNALTGQALLNEILLQRRLELAFEGDRFWDMKRRNESVIRDGSKGDLANGGGIPYVFTTLSAGDYKFQLPFPQTEVNFNTNLKQNPGY
jgi:starch-binding outer membrane protein, SusD/RagB family